MNEYIGVIITIIIIGLVVYLLSGKIKETLLVVGGWGVYDSIDSIYNFILWPLVQNNYGSVGVIYLIIGAVFLNFSVLYWYQKTGIDWLGVKYLEQIKNREEEFSNKFLNHRNILVRVLMYLPVRLFKFIMWLLKKNDVFAFVFLSLFNDSFIVTAFLRHGKFSKLGKRDYLIFIGSTLLGCFVWFFLVGFGLSIIHTVVGWLF